MPDGNVNALYEIADHVSRGDTADETLASAVKVATALVNCDECCTYVRQGVELVPWVWKYVKNGSLDRESAPVGDGFAAVLAARRSPVAVYDDSSHARSFRDFEDWSTDPGERFICVPFLSRSRLLGAMTLHHWNPRSYSRLELKFLCTIGYLVGADLGIASLEKENSDLLLELETRKLVERSKGILQRDLGMNEQEAYAALQRQSEQKRRPMKEIAQAVRHTFGLKPREIIEHLELLRPIFQKTAAYGHFGRSEKEFTWEATPRVDDLRAALGL